MKFNKYYLMSAVFCMALASCSDDVVDDQNGNPQNPTEQVEGETTYATFSFNFSKGVLSRAARATDAGTTAEQNIKNFTLLIFKYDQAHEELSTLEVMQTITAAGEDATEAERTVTTLVTSGPKKVYILANATKLLGQINASDALTLNKTLLSVFEKKVFAVAYDGGSDNMNGVLGDATNGLLMTGVADANLVSGIQVADFTSNGNGPTTEAANNVVKVFIDRASAKISMGVKDVEGGTGVKTFTVPAQSQTSQHVFVDKDLSTDLGTLPLASSTEGGATPYMKFAIYNQNTTEFVVPNIGSVNNASNFVEDPNYTVTDNGTYSMYFNWTFGADAAQQTDFYTEYDGTAHNGTTTQGKSVANLAASNEGTNLFYVPENTNQWATKGNTTYAMIEGTFVPDVTRTIDASSETNAFQSASTAGTFLFKKAGAAITAGSGFVYCEDYDAFFTADMSSGTLARKTTVSSAIPNLNAIKYIAAKMISDANQAATGSADAMKAKLIGGSNSDVTGYGLSALTVVAETPTTFSANQWYAIVTADASRNVGVNDATSDNAQYFTIEVKRANSAGNALLVTATNNVADGVGSTVAYIPTQKVTIAVYPQGKCYYRVNIEDPAYSNTITPFRYAVIRNYWYQIGLSKFTALGYPNPAIAAGVVSDALGADTNVKTTIEVRAWTVITMDPEVGL